MNTEHIEWVYGKTHRGTDGETEARRRINAEGRAELEIRDGDGWLRCVGDGYFTPNTQTMNTEPKTAAGWAKNHFFGIVTLEGATELCQRIMDASYDQAIEDAADTLRLIPMFDGQKKQNALDEILNLRKVNKEK